MFLLLASFGDVEITPGSGTNSEEIDKLSGVAESPSQTQTKPKKQMLVNMTK